MNPSSILIRTDHFGVRWLHRLSIIALALGLATGLSASVITDDFNDGNDDGWTRLDSLAQAVDLGLIPGPVAPPVEWTFPDGAYRIHAPAPAIEDLGPARAFSYREDAESADFYVAVDILDWRDDLDQAFGFLVRGSNIGIGQTLGYVVNYNPLQDIEDEPRGEFQINKVTDEAEDGTLVNAEVKLQAGRSYRFAAMFEGSTLKGYIYDREDLSRPLVEITVEDSSYPSGMAGVFTFYRGDNSSDPQNVADTTFDNFYWTDELAGIKAMLPATTVEPFGGIDLVEKTPESDAVFHPAAEGVRLVFNAEDDSAEVPSPRYQFELTLNGNDASSQLEVEKTLESGSTYRFVVTYEGLQPNRPYEAQFRVMDSSGATGEPRLVHTWNFDTLDPGIFESDEAMAIEIENYNFGALTCDFTGQTVPESGGQFIEDAPLTSTDENGEPVPAEVQGYAHTTGKPEVDYFDFSEPLTSIEEDDSLYRLCDGAATRYTGDVTRPAYEALDIRDNEVYRTEAGEWWNFTRTFPEGSWNAYLRLSSRAEQEISLDQVTGDTTTTAQSLTPLGSFQVPNTVNPAVYDGSQGNPAIYRYVPLTDAEGRMVALDIAGEQTLRLTVAGEPQAYSQKFTMFLNYLLLLPAQAEAPVEPELRAVLVAGDQFQFSFTTQSGVNYTVMYKDDLNAAEWQTLEQFTGDGAERLVEDALTDSMRIYRVQAE